MSALSPLSQSPLPQRPQVIPAVIPVMATPDSMESEAIGEDMELNVIGNTKGMVSVEFPRASTDEVVGSLEDDEEGIHSDTEDLSVLKSVNTIKMDIDNGADADNLDADVFDADDLDAEDHLLEENTEGIAIKLNAEDSEYDLDPFQTPD